GVNQHLAMQGNIAGYANFQNDIYQTYKGANSGDVASLMALPQFQGAEGVGTRIGHWANTAVLARAGGGAAQIAAGAAESGASLNPLSAVFNTEANVSALKVGSQDLMAGGAVPAEALSDSYFQVSKGHADIAGRQAYMARVR